MARQETKAELHGKCAELMKENDNLARRVRAAEFRIAELEKELRASERTADNARAELDSMGTMLTNAHQVLDVVKVPSNPVADEVNEYTGLWRNGKFTLAQRIVFYIARKGAY